MRFTNLMHHIDQHLLRDSYRALNPKAAPGVDAVTWQQYGQGLNWRIRKLHREVHSGGYRAQPSLRLYIPKADGRERPIGIAALEDKIVQHAVVTILNSIYEEEFLGLSYGFRPGRDQHQALDGLYVALTERKVEWVLDGDIRGFFDNIRHDWMLRFVNARVADARIQRLISKWLKAGVSEDGQWSQTEKGTPQGAVISPLLANIYLHYALDQWVVWWRKTQARGEVYMVRFADDFVIGFEHESDARRLQADLRRRLECFGLELHPEKTRLIEFGRHAAQKRAERGESKPETFNFLGFTHMCACRRSDGRFTIWRNTMKERLNKKVAEVREQLMRRRTDPLAAQGRWLRSVCQGHLRYYGVPNNWEALSRFLWQIGMAWYAALRRRSQKARRLNWDKMKTTIERWLPKARIIHPWPDKRFHERRAS